MSFNGLPIIIFFISVNFITMKSFTKQQNSRKCHPCCVPPRGRSPQILHPYRREMMIIIIMSTKENIQKRYCSIVHPEVWGKEPSHVLEEQLNKLPQFTILINWISFNAPFIALCFSKDSFFYSSLITLGAERRIGKAILFKTIYSILLSSWDLFLVPGERIM